MNVRTPNPRIKKTIQFLVILLLVLGVAIFQDFLSSRYHDYAFYASESLLFNLFWVLVLPIAAVFRWLYLKKGFLRQIQSKILRNAIFVSLSTSLHLVLISGLVHLISWTFYEATFTFIGNLEYSISEELYIYLLIYAVISLVIFRKNSSQTEPTPSSYREYLGLSNGRINSRIAVSEIIYFSAASPYVSIHTADKKHLQQMTLKALLSQLDPKQFVQIHKSTIVNLLHIQSYHSRLNGDYDVKLYNGEELRLSRNYVDNFRQKFEARTTA